MSCAILFNMQGGTSGRDNYPVSTLTTQVKTALQLGALTADGANHVLTALADAGYPSNISDDALRVILVRLINRGHITADAANRIIAE